MAALKCTKEEEWKIQKYARSLVQLLTEYRWLTDSYVVEFFAKDHWSKLPKSWQESLCDVQLKQSAGFFCRDPGVSCDGYKCYQEYDIPTDLLSKLTRSSVWPLSLLAFCSATQSLALKRHPREAQPLEGEETPAQLDHCFKYHVKHKKRHEIQTLAKLINKACKASDCCRVVDVGGGQGHLTRLLAVGYGLSVMSIDAEGCHVNGAAKVDRKVEVLRQKKERKGLTDIRRPSSAPPQSPVHVVCTIKPDISVQNFVKIVNKHLQLQKTSQENFKNAQDDKDSDSVDKGCDNENKASHTSCKSNNEKRPLEAFSKNATDKVAGDVSLNSVGNKEEMKDTVGKDDRIQKYETTTKSDFYQEETQRTLLEKMETGQEAGDMEYLPSKKIKTQKSGSSLTPGHSLSDIYQGKSCFKEESNTSDSDIQTSSKSEQLSVCDSSKLKDDVGINQFALVGLHTCGDLGPTILRVFIKCPDAQVLASVGCCYMKMQCVQPVKELDREPESSETRNLTEINPHDGFPMSTWIQNLDGSDLTFEPLELACHFFDSYYERLKVEDPNLILQAYRAMLEILIQRASPDLVKKHAGIRQIKKATASIKKAHSMTFESYAEAAFKKLGLTFDPEAARFVEKEHRPQWKHLIIFHSLRLTLAPIVESLVLVDRMLYLLENGVESSLTAVFDPHVSPRNFLLQAKKM